MTEPSICRLLNEARSLLTFSDMVMTILASWCSKLSESVGLVCIAVTSGESEASCQSAALSLSAVDWSVGSWKLLNGASSGMTARNEFWVISFPDLSLPVCHTTYSALSCGTMPEEVTSYTALYLLVLPRL